MLAAKDQGPSREVPGCTIALCMLVLSRRSPQLWTWLDHSDEQVPEGLLTPLIRDLMWFNHPLQSTRGLDQQYEI